VLSIHGITADTLAKPVGVDGEQVVAAQLATPTTM